MSEKYTGHEFLNQDTEQVQPIEWGDSSALKRGLKKAGRVAVLGATLIANEARAQAQSVWHDVLRQGPSVAADVIRTKSDEKTRQREIEQRDKSDSRNAEVQKEEIRTRKEIELARIKAEAEARADDTKGRTHEASIRAAEQGVSAEIKISPDGKSISIESDAEVLKFKKFVNRNIRTFKIIRTQLEANGGNFEKVWPLVDKSGKLSQAERQKIEAEWEDINEVLENK